jgi:RNA polymerase sigma-70 factor (ECF subfamily)
MDSMGTPVLRLVQVGPASSARPKLVPDAGYDAELVGRVLEHDRAAFEELYRRHAPFAFSLVVRLQGSKTDVEDLVHDAFLRVHSDLAGLRDPGSFRAWLGSIVVSQVRMRMRRGRLLRALGLGSSDPVDLDSLASEAAGPDVRAQLAQLYALLRVMPADERIAWTLRHVERHRLEELAELTGCSLATAKRRLQRAQRFLDEHFVSSGIEPKAAVEGAHGE